MDPWAATDLSFDEEEFDGVARLFPLPNLVLYPHVVQPLHVFEERYREMIQDALAGDGLITMAVLQPGWEPDYESRPPVAPTGCLGKIVAHHRLQDGRYNLLLLGMRRVQIVYELDPIRSFRQAFVELIDDCYSEDESLDPEQLRQQLLDEFQANLPAESDATEHLDQLLAGYVPLGALTDLVSYAMPLDMHLKQKLLAERCVERRAILLLKQLAGHCQESTKKKSSADRGFPPLFSAN